MIRNLKMLGLSVVALLAMTAVAASAASAAEFHAESAPVIYEGEQVTTNEFTVTTGIVKCSKATFTGTNPNKTSFTSTVHPTYTGCKAFGVAATVNTVGCDYIFHVEGGASPAVTDVKCAEGSEIKVTPIGINCIVTVTNQEGVNGVSLTSEGLTTARDIKATAGSTNVKYTEAGAGCAGAGFHETGTYTGTVTMKGFVDNGGEKGAQQGIWVE